GYTVKVDKFTIINTLDPSKKNTSNNLNKTPSTPKQGFLPKAGEKASILFLIVGLCEILLIFLLSYLLKNRHQLV
ncbi:LPXTG cell wall anchor domain-containing protein, partial [Enterococcus faecalis]